MNTVPKRYRRTDGQLTVASPRSALASRGKKRLEKHGKKQTRYKNHKDTRYRPTVNEKKMESNIFLMKRKECESVIGFESRLLDEKITDEEHTLDFLQSELFLVLI